MWNLDLRRTLVSGCPCSEGMPCYNHTQTGASMAERPMLRRRMHTAMTKVGEGGIAIPSKVWTDEDVQKEKTSSAITGATLGAIGGMMLAWWVFK